MDMAVERGRRRRDGPKRSLITSASTLPTQARRTCAMPSRPETATLHRLPADRGDHGRLTALIAYLAFRLARPQWFLRHLRKTRIRRLSSTAGGTLRDPLIIVDMR